MHKTPQVDLVEHLGSFVAEPESWVLVALPDHTEAAVISHGPGAPVVLDGGHVLGGDEQRIVHVGCSPPRLAAD